MLKRLFFALGLYLAQSSMAGALDAPQSGNDKPSAPAAKPDPFAKRQAFGDWVMVCQNIGTPDKPIKNCEMVQTINAPNQTAPFAKIAIGKLGPKEPLMITVAVPINVSFPSIVLISANDKDPTPQTLAWRRCMPAGCFANSQLKDDVLKNWRGQTEASGHVVFTDANGQNVIMPYSFKGFGPAMEAVSKEY